MKLFETPVKDQAENYKIGFKPFYIEVLFILKITFYITFFVIFFTTLIFVVSNRRGLASRSYSQIFTSIRDQIKEFLYSIKSLFFSPIEEEPVTWRDILREQIRGRLSQTSLPIQYYPLKVIDFMLDYVYEMYLLLKTLILHPWALLNQTRIKLTLNPWTTDQLHKMFLRKYYISKVGYNIIYNGFWLAIGYSFLRSSNIANKVLLNFKESNFSKFFLNFNENCLYYYHTYGPEGGVTNLFKKGLNYFVEMKNSLNDMFTDDKPTEKDIEDIISKACKIDNVPPVPSLKNDVGLEAINLTDHTVLEPTDLMNSIKFRVVNKDKKSSSTPNIISNHQKNSLEPNPTSGIIRLLNKEPLQYKNALSCIPVSAVDKLPSTQGKPAEPNPQKIYNIQELITQELIRLDENPSLIPLLLKETSYLRLPTQDQNSQKETLFKIIYIVEKSVEGDETSIIKIKQIILKVYRRDRGSHIIQQLDISKSELERIYKALDKNNRFVVVKPSLKPFILVKPETKTTNTAFDKNTLEKIQINDYFQIRPKIIVVCYSTIFFCIFVRYLGESISSNSTLTDGLSYLDFSVFVSSRKPIFNSSFVTEVHLRTIIAAALETILLLVILHSGDRAITILGLKFYDNTRAPKEESLFNNISLCRDILNIDSGLLIPGFLGGFILFTLNRMSLCNTHKIFSWGALSCILLKMNELTVKHILLEVASNPRKVGNESNFNVKIIKTMIILGVITILLELKNLDDNKQVFDDIDYANYPALKNKVRYTTGEFTNDVTDSTLPRQMAALDTRINDEDTAINAKNAQLAQDAAKSTIRRVAQNLLNIRSLYRGFNVIYDDRFFEGNPFSKALKVIVNSGEATRGLIYIFTIKLILKILNLSGDIISKYNIIAKYDIFYTNTFFIPLLKGMVESIVGRELEKEPYLVELIICGFMSVIAFMIFYGERLPLLLLETINGVPVRKNQTKKIANCYLETASRPAPVAAAAAPAAPAGAAGAAALAAPAAPGALVAGAAAIRPLDEYGMIEREDDVKSILQTIQQGAIYINPATHIVENDVYESSRVLLKTYNTYPVHALWAIAEYDVLRLYNDLEPNTDTAEYNKALINFMKMKKRLVYYQHMDNLLRNKLLEKNGSLQWTPEIDDVCLASIYLNVEFRKEYLEEIGIRDRISDNEMLMLSEVLSITKPPTMRAHVPNDRPTEEDWLDLMKELMIFNNKLVVKKIQNNIKTKINSDLLDRIRSTDNNSKLSLNIDLVSLKAQTKNHMHALLRGAFGLLIFRRNLYRDPTVLSYHYLTPDYRALSLHGVPAPAARLTQTHGITCIKLQQSSRIKEFIKNDDLYLPKHSIPLKTQSFRIKDVLLSMIMGEFFTSYENTPKPLILQINESGNNIKNRLTKSSLILNAIYKITMGLLVVYNIIESQLAKDCTLGFFEEVIFLNDSTLLGLMNFLMPVISPLCSINGVLFENILKVIGFNNASSSLTKMFHAMIFIYYIGVFDYVLSIIWARLSMISLRKLITLGSSILLITLYIVVKNKMSELRVILQNPNKVLVKKSIRYIAKTVKKFFPSKKIKAR